METIGTSLTRRERERKRRRQAILAAARSVFAERGYRNATLDEVAARAEFGKGTLYNYFEGGKEDLLFAIFDEIYEEVHTLVKEHLVAPYRRGRPLREVFRDHVACCFELFLEKRDLLMILVKESQRLMFSDEPDKAAYFIAQEQRAVELVLPVLEDAMARGEIRNLPPRSVANMLRGNIMGFLTHMCMMEDTHGVTGELPPLSIENATQVLTSVLFDGLQAPSSSP